MSDMTINIDDSTREWLEAQAKRGGFPDVQAFFTHLLNQVKTIHDDSELELHQALLEALNSPSVPVTPEFWEQREQELMRRLQSNASARNE